MCTSVILFRKDHYWPLIIGSNRDEKFSRKSKFPARHWPNLYPQIIGGFDIEKKGSWIAINDFGLVAIMHNRKLNKNNSLIKKSRGHLILELLNFNKIVNAINFLKKTNQSIYNGFNILIGDKSNCFWCKHDSVDKEIVITEVNEGLSILTDKDLNNLNDKKTNHYLKKFSQAPVPEPNNNEWLSWELLLSTDKIDDQEYPEEAICFNNKIMIGKRVMT